MNRRHPDLGAKDAPLSENDVEGAIRVFQSLEKLMARPQLIKSSRPETQQLLNLAKRLRALRAARASFLPQEIFAEPGWDILLALYIAEQEQYRMKITAVCNESGVAGTTALRWIESLVELGLLRRERNNLDARSSHVSLTSDALERMDRLLAQIWSEHFPFE